MDKEAKKIFAEIKAKAEKDKELWNKAQEDDTVHISSEEEDVIMERMFLVYYVEKFLEERQENQQLKEGLEKVREQVSNNDYIEEIQWTIAKTLGELDKEELKTELN